MLIRCDLVWSPLQTLLVIVHDHRPTGGDTSKHQMGALVQKRERNTIESVTPNSRCYHLLTIS